MMNIALIGYGRMGREIEASATERNHTISYRFSSKNPFSESPVQSTDCCIDFSSPNCVELNVSQALSLGIPIVIGTTGWADRMERIRALVEEHNGSVVYASNFSLGANILFRIVETASSIMKEYGQYDVSVHETHHAMKKDAPSGTALTIAQRIIERIGRKNRIAVQAGSTNDLVVSSARVGNVVGEHAVRFNSAGDDIVISHTAHNRTGFALGAVLAAEWIVGKNGLFTFEEMLWKQEHEPVRE